MKKLLAPLLLSLVALLLGGCTNHMAAAVAGLRTEIVKLQRDSNGNLQVTWRMNNPNVVGYVITRNALKITLDGVPVGTVTSSERIGIPALNHAERVSVLTVEGPSADQALAQALARGSAGYTVDATIWLLKSGEDIEKFGLTGSGTVPVTAE